MSIDAIQNKAITLSNTKISNYTASKTTDSSSIMTMPANIATKIEFGNTKGPDPIKKTVSEDIKSRILTKETKTSWFGFKKEEYYVYDGEKYAKEHNGKELTYGQIKKRYNLGEGVIKGADPDVYIPSHTKLKNPVYTYSDNKPLDHVYPGEVPNGLGGKKVKIPVSALQKYLTK